MFEKPRRWWHGARLGRCVLGFVFLYSGAVKLADLPSFHSDVLGYQMVYGPLAGWITVLVPVIELIVALCLLLHRLVAAACAAILGMLTVFTFGIGYAMQRGLDIRCGCFGPAADKMTGPLSIAINVGLFLFTLWLLTDHLRGARDERPGYTFSRDLLKR